MSMSFRALALAGAAASLVLGGVVAADAAGQRGERVTPQQRAAQDAAAARATKCDGCWAVVDADGTLRRGEGAVEVNKGDVGGYHVRFQRGVTACVWQATLADPATSNLAPVGGTGISRSSFGNRWLWVDTYDADGGYVDAPFMVLITC